MGRSGFSTIEMIIVIIMLAVIAAMGFPRIRGTLDKTNVRSARVYLGTAVVTARQSSIARSCRAVFHVNAGAGTVWVTACPRLKAGAGTIDTLGPVEQLAARYNVKLTASRDSVQFDPRGLSQDNATAVVWIVGTAAGNRDSAVINALGKVMR